MEVVILSPLWTGGPVVFPTIDAIASASAVVRQETIVVSVLAILASEERGARLMLASVLMPTLRIVCRRDRMADMNSSAKRSRSRSSRKFH